MTEDLALDHVVLAVSDLAAGADWLRDRTGLDAVPGGKHAGLGTANALAPLAAGAYVELVAVVDVAAAAGAAWGRAVLAAAGEAPSPLLWCVRSADLDATAARLGLTDVRQWSRRRPDGPELRWRLAGLGSALAYPLLPFFIEWDVPAPLHPAAGGGTVQIDALELSGDSGRLNSWLGGVGFPVTVVDGPPALRRLVLHGPAGRTSIP